MKIDRRAFLQQTVATPFLFGLADLLSQEPVTGSPEWFQKALKRMKETGRYGIVLVAPDLAPIKPEKNPVPANEDEKRLQEILRELKKRQEPAEAEAPRRRMGKALWILANDDHPAAHEILCEAVFIGMTPEIADWSIRRAGDKRTRFLLDPEGNRVAADSVDIETLESPEKFVASFRAFLHGEGNDRLRAQAEAIGKGLSKEVQSALSKLGSDSVQEREDAHAFLVKRADPMVPYLVHAAMTAPQEEQRARLHDILKDLFKPTKEDATGPRLPYGCVLPKFGSGCGTPVPEEEVMIACGMAVVRAKPRKFLRFLAK